MPKPFGLLALGLAALLPLTACGGSDGEPASSAENPSTSTTASPPSSGPSTTTAPAPPSTAAADFTIEVALAGGQVIGGPRKETVNRGARVRIRATSDVVEVLHVHTYDLKANLQPGQPGELDFEATIPGRHEVEFEESKKVALTLEVR